MHDDYRQKPIAAFSSEFLAQQHQSSLEEKLSENTEHWLAQEAASSTYWVLIEQAFYRQGGSEEDFYANKGNAYASLRQDIAERFPDARDRYNIPHGYVTIGPIPVLA